jgi:hypothetical protein
MPRSGAKKPEPTAARKTKGKAKDGKPSMALDHDVAIPKNFPLKLKKKSGS